MGRGTHSAAAVPEESSSAILAACWLGHLSKGVTMFSLKAMIKPQAIPVVAAALRELRIPGMSARDIGRMKVRNANMCNVEKEAHNAHKVRLEVVVTDEQKRVTEKAIMAAVAESGQLAVDRVLVVASDRVDALVGGFRFEHAETGVRV